MICIEIECKLASSSSSSSPTHKIIDYNTLQSIALNRVAIVSCNRLIRKPTNRSAASGVHCTQRMRCDIAFAPMRRTGHRAPSSMRPLMRPNHLLCTRVWRSALALTPFPSDHGNALLGWRAARWWTPKEKDFFNTKSNYTAISSVGSIVSKGCVYQFMLRAREHHTTSHIRTTIQSSSRGNEFFLNLEETNKALKSEETKKKRKKTLHVKWFILGIFFLLRWSVAFLRFKRDTQRKVFARSLAAAIFFFFFY